MNNNHLILTFGMVAICILGGFGYLHDQYKHSECKKLEPINYLDVIAIKDDISFNNTYYIIEKTNFGFEIQGTLNGKSKKVSCSEVQKVIE